MASNYKVNYNDKQLKAIDTAKNDAIKESDKTFNGMINQTDKFYNDQITAVENYGKEQEKLQQDRTDLAIEKIEQQKDQAYKDFQKEGSAAYVDWQKQTDDYGSNAEKMASMGLASSGYSESSQVAMYNQYQNRVAMAKESFDRAVLNFNNGINEAILQNSSALAEIRYNTLQASLELSLQGFQYKNDLVLRKAQEKREIDNTYYSRYQDRIAQINHENSMAEQQRQFNLNRELELKKYNESVRQFNEQLKEEKRQYNETLALQKKKSNVSSSGGSGSGSGSGKVTKSKEMPSNIKDAKRDNSQATKNAALKKASSVKTKQDAQKLLKSLGITSGISIIDSVAWNKAKRMGDGGSDVQNFKNYAAYVQAYCKGVINGKF